MIRNFVEVTESENVIQDLETNLVRIDIEGMDERIEKAGYDQFGCVDFLNPFILKLLDPKILDDLNRVAGSPNYFKRIPLYKRLTKPSGNDIVYKWHLDREKPLFSMLVYLTDVDETKPKSMRKSMVREAFSP